MNLLLIQILIPAFALFALVSAFKKWKRREMSVGMGALLAVFWVGVVVAVLLPQSTQMLAALFGVGRGADLVVYVSVVVMMYLLFRMYVRTERLEREITKLVREIALRDKNRP